jgi:hypothetical protein
MEPNKVKTVDIPTLVLAFGRKLLYCTCCVGRCLVIMQKAFVWPNISSFSIIAYIFENWNVECLLDSSGGTKS